MELQQAQLYKPSVEDGGGGADQRPGFDSFDGPVEAAGRELAAADQCETVGDMDDSQLVGGADQTVVGMVSGKVGQQMVENTAVTAAAEKSLAKPRRGRPPSGHAKPKPPVRKKPDEEEDVCFICFDGGSLVLCDRRGCPKAYHPSCIKRDEAFFKSKAKWNCGWHICSSCQKASHYWCYTCTYSLCKACTKDADYQSVRGSKGFCGTCMRTIMLIENVQENKEAQVDFDDKSSWEYLFKVYWILLKGKLSLTLDELLKAKNPWNQAAVVACKRDALGKLYDGHKTRETSSVNSFADLEAPHSQRSNKKPRLLDKDLSIENSLGDGRMSFPEGTVWATKELLEFVAHMKNGDVSVLSQFDVQALLLEYIKKNNLRDPRQKCQIICDSRLISLFGKEVVGHIEMLKLLEFHFLLKESSRAEKISSAAIVNTFASQMELDGNYDSQMTVGNDKRRRTRKRVDERGPQTNPAAYAAIDVHNINLIYLRRKWVESLLEDVDKFHEKVVGSVVRIRISNGDQKQEIYRLVQVTGTSKVAEPYKIGTRTTDVKLEILNLDKKEIIAIDEISNQEFSQDECKRLRQSIRCGLSKRFSVGEIQEKAVALQSIRVNDCLEAEVLRFNNLRDRASEKGHRKELRECVEKLQLLNSPEERQRRLGEIPKVHLDPSTDPSYESEDSAGASDKKQDNKIKRRKSVAGRKGRKPFSQPREGDISNDIGGKAHKSRGRETFGINGCNAIKNQVIATGLAVSDWNNHSVGESNSFTEVTSEISSLPFSAIAKTDLSFDKFEADKIWHYQDPTGKVQGPFALVQLRKWSTTGLFPPNHRIWRTNEEPDNSILLTDAVNGQYSKEPLLPHDSHLPSPKITAALDDRNNGQDGKPNSSVNATPIVSRMVEESWNTKQTDQSLHRNANSGLLRTNTPADVVNSNEVQTAMLLQGCDPLKGNNSLSNQVQENSSLPSPVLPVEPDEIPSHKEGESRGAESKSDQKCGNLDLQLSAQGQTINGQCNENQIDNEGHSLQSSGGNGRPPPVSSPSNGCDSNSDFVPMVKSHETSEQGKMESSLSDPMPKPSDGDLQGQAAENKPSVSSDVPVEDAGPSWSTGSSLVGGGAQLQEVGGEWGGYSPTPAKRSIEEWESSLVSASSLKASELAVDCIGPAVSLSGQLTHSSPSHPTSNASGWQAILTEPTEFCTLADESVSDLLAEVEAMESLSGLATPTSLRNCGGEFTEGSKNDSMSSVEGFSPALDPGKGDALSSNGDVRVPVVTDEPLGLCQGTGVDRQQRSRVHSSTSTEAEGDRKHSDVSVNEWETGTEVPTEAAPSKESWDLTSTDNQWKARPDSRETNFSEIQGNANMGWGGSDQGSTNMGWGGGHPGITHGNASMYPGGPAGGGMWESQSRYGGDRFLGQRDRGFQNRESGAGRGRFAWNRQAYHGNGNGGSFRPSPKGQRVCKYYESGHCKKGASCGYLHP